MKYLLIIVSTVFIQFGLNGQSKLGRTSGYDPVVINWLNELNKKSSQLGEDENLKLTDIEGSMYFNKDFILGKTYYRNELYENFLIRYNAFSDQIEIKREDKNIEGLYKSAAISCEINREKFIFLKFIDNNGLLDEGYLVAVILEKKIFSI